VVRAEQLLKAASPIEARLLEKATETREVQLTKARSGRCVMPSGSTACPSVTTTCQPPTSKVSEPGGGAVPLGGGGVEGVDAGITPFVETKEFHCRL